MIAVHCTNDIDTCVLRREGVPRLNLNAVNQRLMFMGVIINQGLTACSPLPLPDLLQNATDCKKHIAGPIEAEFSPLLGQFPPFLLAQQYFFSKSPDSLQPGLTGDHPSAPTGWQPKSTHQRSSGALACFFWYRRHGGLYSRNSAGYRPWSGKKRRNYAVLKA